MARKINYEAINKNAVKNLQYVDNELQKAGYKNQTGGLIYTPFINKEIQTNDDLYDWTDNQWYFPVEPVHISTETTEEPTTTQSSTPTQTPVQEEVATTPTVTSTIESTVTPGNIKIRSSHPDTGKMKDFLDLLASEGISLTVTSGTRPNATTKSGHKSRHGIGEAIDVVAENGKFDDLEKKILASKKIRDYMIKNRVRILKETNPRVLSHTGGTGNHFHISVNGERFGRNVWDDVIAFDDDWYTYTGRQRPILRFGGILQRGGLIYTPFVPNKQDLLWDNSIVDNEIPFPVEPVRISNPTPIQETTSKPEETVKESPVVETPVTEEPVIGKIYTSKEKEQFKSDMYNAYFSELSSRGLDNNLADAFAKRLTTQDILESGWGQSSLSKYFNFGGIKDFRSNSNPVVLTTHEYENGERKTKKQPFRRFNNLSEYIKYKIDLVSKNWKVFDDIPEMYFENLVKGRLKYATSPTYADKLDRLFKSIWKTT